MVPKHQNPKDPRRNNSFLEALRGLGDQTKSSFTNDLLREIPNDALTQAGLKKPQERTPFQSENLILERENLRRRLQATELIRTQETIVFSAKQKESEERVKLLQEEALKLVKATQNLSQEVEAAIVQEPVEVGIYHENFFEKIISFLHHLTKKVNEATVWFSASAARSKKRSYYWGQVRKSGGKYMLSQERYMATQAG